MGLRVGNSLRNRVGTIVYTPVGAGGNPLSETDQMKGVIGYGGTIDLTPTANYLQADAGVQGFNQAQDMDFNAMVAAAENTPVQLTQDQYDAMVKEIKALNDNELLSSDDIRIGTSNILSQNGIVNDQSSLFSGSDAGGLLSKRFVIIDPESGGAESGAGQESSDTDDAAETITGAAQDSDLLDDDVDTTITADGAAAAESILSSSAETAGTNQAQEGVFSASDAIYADYEANPDRYITSNTIARQLHQAAVMETDPVLKQALIDELFGYTQVPFDPDRPPLPIVKRVGMGYTRDDDGNLVPGAYIGVYDAASNKFKMPDGRMVAWNGESSTDTDGNLIVPQDGASYTLLGKYDADGNLDTRSAGIEHEVPGPEADDGLDMASADDELTEDGLITILNTQGLPGLQGILIVNDMSLEDAKTTFPGLAAAVDQLGNTNSGTNTVVSGGDSNAVTTTVATDGSNNAVTTDANGSGANTTTVTGATDATGTVTGTTDATGTVTGSTNVGGATVGGTVTGGTTTGTTNTVGGANGDTTLTNSTTTSSGGGVLTGGNNQGGSVITSGTNDTSGGTNNVTGNTNTGTGLGAGVLGTTIGPGSGPGLLGDEGTDDVSDVLNAAPINESIFANDIARIRLAPTGLMSRLFG